MISAAYANIPEVLKGHSLQEIEEKIAKLPALCKEHIMEKKDTPTKLQSFVAVMLSFELFKDLGIDPYKEEYELRNGRPSMKNRTDIDFNISHSGNIALVAIENGKVARVGADIEKVQERPNIPALAERFMSEKEIKLLSENDYTAKQFTKIWTKKEALVKFRGTGLAANIRVADTVNPIDSVKFSEFLVEKEYAVAICLRLTSHSPRTILKREFSI